jgi:hypothetical protein
MGKGGMRFLIAFVLLFVFNTDVSSQTNRLQPSDLVYRGAFRLPAGMAAYGGDAIAYRPDGSGGQGSLIIHGHAYNAEAGEFAIPTPVVTTTVSAMPEAQQLQPFADIGGAVWTKYRQSYGGSTEVNGFVYYQETGKPNKLCWAFLNWYNVTATNDNSFVCSDPPGQTPNPVGAAHPGPRSNPNWHSNQIGGYLFQIPSSVATRFGNAANMLCAGFHRFGGAFGGSMGPTINCFNPWNGSSLYGDGAEIPGGTTVLRYPTYSSDCWLNNSCVFPGYQVPDRWVGAQYVSIGGKEAILIAGTKGLGMSAYTGGWHAAPYENRVMFYDVDELAQFAKGQRPSVVPYAHFVPPVIVPASINTYKTYGAMAYDSLRQRLYVVDACAVSDCTPIIQVWDVGGSSGGSSGGVPPASPSNLIVK